MARHFVFVLLFLCLFAQANIRADSKPQDVDPAFQFGVTNSSVIHDMLLLPDGRIAFGGTGLEPSGILNADGSLNLFGGYTVQIDTVETLALCRDGAVLKGGPLAFDAPVGRFGRIWMDTSFHWKVLGELATGPAAPILHKLLIQNSDGDIIAAGSLTLTGSTNAAGLVRLKRTGAADRTFDSQSSEGLVVSAASLDSASQIFASYSYTNSAGELRYGFGRWLANGARDMGYSPAWLDSISPGARVVALAREPGLDSTLAAVQFNRGADIFTRIVRLDAQGTAGASTSFPEILGVVNAIGFCPAQPQAEGAAAYNQILVAGDFKRAGEVAWNDLAVFSPAGMPLWGFGPDEGPDAAINAVSGQPDGRVLIGGAFAEVSGTAANGMARLEGLGAAGKTFVFWDNTELIGFEKAGVVEAALNRRGDIETALTVSIVPETTAMERLGTNRLEITFQPSERRKLISIPITQNQARDGSIPVLLKAGNLPSPDFSYTPAAIFVVDDETPGTRDPSFIAPIPFPVTAMAPQTDGRMLLGYKAGGPRLGRMNTDGNFDFGFQTNAIPFNATYQEVHQIAPAPDGKIYAAGSFMTSTSPAGTNLIVKLNADGTLDPAFHLPLVLGPTYPSDPLKFALQNDGGVIISQGAGAAKSFWIGGIFVYGAPPYRLNPNGTVDSLYNQNPFSNIQARQVEELPNGETLISGRHSSTAGLFILDHRGDLDTNFSCVVKGRMELGPDVYAFVQEGSTILIAGDFTSVNGAAASGLARVNAANGQFETALNFAADGPVHQVLKRPDGKIYIAGSFTRVNGVDRFRVARLLPDGSLDSTYDPGLQFQIEPLVQLQSDGKLLACEGTYWMVGPDDSARLVLLEDDPTPGVIRFVSEEIRASESAGFAAIEVERIGGSFGSLSAMLQTVDGSARSGSNYAGGTFAVTFADGEFGRKSVQVPIFASPELTGNKTFAIQLNFAGMSETATVLVQDEQVGTTLPSLSAWTGGDDSVIRDIALLPDGSFLAGGRFTSIQGIPMTNLARLTPDFAVDASFVPRGPAAPAISHLAVRADGRIVLGGPFQSVGGSNWAKVVQLNPDLTYDAEFNAGVRAAWPISSGGPGLVDLKIAPDGKLYAAETRILRFNMDGTGDSFTSIIAGMNTLFPLPGGTLLAGGQEFSYGTLWHFGADGALETNFFPGRRSFGQTFTGNGVRAIESDGVGGFYVGGNFMGFVNGGPWRLAHVFGSGTLDTNFNPFLGKPSIAQGSPVDGIRTMALLKNGDLLVAGDFTEADWHEQPLIARMAPNGRLRDFRPDLQGTNIQKMLLLPDGSVLILGSVTNVNGVETGSLFKLRMVDELPPIVQILIPTNGTDFELGDGIPPFEIRVHAFDPDGFLETVRLELDGNAISTNTTGFTVNTSFPGEGQHQLRAIALDQSGLASTNVVDFSVRFAPFPLRLSIRMDEAKHRVVIHSAGAQLQESSDLKTWQNVPESENDAGSDYTVSPAMAHRFYRLVQ